MSSEAKTRYRQRHLERLRKDDLEFYHRNKSSINPARNERRRQRLINDPEYAERIRLQRRHWYQTNKERMACHNKASYLKNRSAIIKRRAAKRHGISLELYESLIEIHQGCCGICGRPCSSKRALAVDHNHVTGKVRGLLCLKCNQGIGQFQDNPNLLRMAADYLERFFIPKKENKL